MKFCHFSNDTWLVKLWSTIYLNSIGGTGTGAMIHLSTTTTLIYGGTATGAMVLLSTTATLI